MGTVRWGTITPYGEGLFLSPARLSCLLPNTALQQLAHATTNKGYSPASPLQALVRQPPDLANSSQAQLRFQVISLLGLRWYQLLADPLHLPGHAGKQPNNPSAHWQALAVLVLLEDARFVSPGRNLPILFPNKLPSHD